MNVRRGSEFSMSGRFEGSQLVEVFLRPQRHHYDPDAQIRLCHALRLPTGVGRSIIHATIGWALRKAFADYEISSNKREPPCTSDIFRVH